MGQSRLKLSMHLVVLHYKSILSCFDVLFDGLGLLHHVSELLFHEIHSDFEASQNLREVGLRLGIGDVGGLQSLIDDG